MPLPALLNPDFLKLGPLTIKWYGLIITSAIGLGIYLADREARRLKLDEEFIYNLAMWVVPIAILGARLYEVFVLRWPYYAENPGKILAIWEGGLAIHGAVIGGAITAYFVTRRHKADFFQWADILMPSVILGQAIGRWGNFFNQEAYGSPAPAWLVDLMPGWFREQMTIYGTVMHPTFLYESLWNLGVFAFLIWYRRQNPKRGSVTALYLVLYNVGRFFIEALRTDSSYWFGTIKVAQAVAVMLMALGLAAYFWRQRTATHYEDPARG